jgi:hypothetical protein
VMTILINKNCIQKDGLQYRLIPHGMDELKSKIKDTQSSSLNIAAYGAVNRREVLKRLDEGPFQHLKSIQMTS